MCLPRLVRHDEEQSVLPMINGRKKIIDDSSPMERADKPPALLPRLLLQHKEGPKYRYSGPDIKKKIEDKGNQDVEGI